jgi:hypothetical protein
MVLLRGGAISSNGIEWKRSSVGRSRLLVSSFVHGSGVYGLLTGRAWLTILLRVEGRIGQCCWSSSAVQTKQRNWKRPAESSSDAKQISVEKIDSSTPERRTCTRDPTSPSLSTICLTTAFLFTVTKNPTLPNKNNRSLDTCTSFNAFATAFPPPISAKILPAASCSTRALARTLSASRDVGCSGSFGGWENGLAGGGRGREVWCSIVRRLGIMDVEPTGFRPRHLTAVRLDR